MRHFNCKVCNRKPDWYLETKQDSDFYCENHAPCGRFKKFIGRYVSPIVNYMYNIYFR